MLDASTVIALCSASPLPIHDFVLWVWQMRVPVYVMAALYILKGMYLSPGTSSMLEDIIL